MKSTNLKKKIKSNKLNSGITLIALVITIIVLLILVGVSLSLVLGEEGLIGRTIGTKEVNENAEEKELVELAVSTAQIDGHGNLNETNLNNALKETFNNSNEVTPNSEGWDYEANKKYNIYPDGRVEDVGNVESILPIEYQQVEYIESSGTQYIDTLYKANGKSSYLLEYSNNKINGVMFGAYNTDWSTGNGVYINATKDNYNPFLHYFSNTRIPIGYYDNGIIKVECGEFYFNDVNYGGPGSKNFDLNYTTYIFAGNWSLIRIEQPTMYRLHYFKIYDINAIYRNFIPCYSTTKVTDVGGEERPSGTVGLYDTVNGQFYVNKGTGTFGYGMEDGTYVAPKNN